MNKTLRLAALCLALLSSPLYAHDMTGMDMSHENKAQVHVGRGIVNSVDAGHSVVNISHEPIKSLDWPAMTMDFPVADKAQLTRIKPGQKVEFELSEKMPDHFTISKIKAVK